MLIDDDYDIPRLPPPDVTPHTPPTPRCRRQPRHAPAMMTCRVVRVDARAGG